MLNFTSQSFLYSYNFGLERIFLNFHGIVRAGQGQRPYYFIFSIITITDYLGKLRKYYKIILLYNVFSNNSNQNDSDNRKLT